MYDFRDDTIRKEERKKISTVLDNFEGKDESSTKDLKADVVKDESFLKSNNTMIYDQDDMFSLLTKDMKVIITRNLKNNKISVKSKRVQKSQDRFFEKLSNELRELAKEYGKEMDELHMLFMEVSCDLGDLKNLLKGEKASKWTMLEDLAIQSEPNSIEFKHICDSKGGQQVYKRKKFLEMNS